MLCPTPQRSPSSLANCLSPTLGAPKVSYKWWLGPSQHGDQLTIKSQSPFHSCNVNDTPYLREGWESSRDQLPKVSISGHIC